MSELFRDELLATTGRYLDRQHLEKMETELQQKNARLAQLNTDWEHTGDIPGALVIGRSSISSSYQRKHEAQMGRASTVAKELVSLRAQIRQLITRIANYKQGKINEQGRSIDNPKSLLNQIMISEEMINGGRLPQVTIRTMQDNIKHCRRLLKKIDLTQYHPDYHT